MKRYITHIIIFLTILAVLPVVPKQGGLVMAGQNTVLDRAAQTEILTLVRAKQIALENSPTLASAMERVNQAREVVAQTRADFFPVISATAGWDYTENTLDSGSEADETLYTSRLSATQVLFDGFSRKYSNLSASLGEQMSLAGQDEARRFLTWSVAQTFLSVQLARENIKIAQSDMAFNRDQEGEAVAKEKAGTGSYSDVLNFKTKVNSAKTSLLSAQQDLNESIHGLAALLGYEDACLPEGMDISPLDIEKPDLNLSRYIDPALESDIETLLSERPDLKEAFLAIEDADTKINIAEAEHYPTISLIGAYGTSAGDSLDDTDNMGASVGINVNIDLFTGGATKARVREALSDKRALQNDLEDARIKALSNVRSSARNFTTARQQLVLQEENTGLIETTRNLVEKEYNAGQVSLVRLNEAQNDLVNAMGELAIARVSLVLALEEFNYYIGKNFNLTLKGSS
ncbi:MAG: TolC family protein [Desulfobacterales bacterium]|nr:TolC family protein [Desulfobacterales bacterium]